MTFLDLLKYIKEYGWMLCGFWAVFVFYKQNSFNKDMENIKTALAKDIKHYEQRLTLLTEEVKYQHNKGSEDFKLWTVKRHKAYAELHEHILKLFFFVGNAHMELAVGYKEIMFINYEKDLMELIQKMGVSLIKQKEITKMWQMDKGGATIILKKILWEDRAKRIGELINIIVDKTYIWSLYLPKKMRDDLLEIQFVLINDGKLLSDEIENKTKKEKLNKVIVTCRDIMNQMVEDLSGELGKDANKI